MMNSEDLAMLGLFSTLFYMYAFVSSLVIETAVLYRLLPNKKVWHVVGNVFLMNITSTILYFLFSSTFIDIALSLAKPLSVFFLIDPDIPLFANPTYFLLVVLTIVFLVWVLALVVETAVLKIRFYTQLTWWRAALFSIAANTATFGLVVIVGLLILLLNQ